MTSNECEEKEDPCNDQLIEGWESNVIQLVESLWFELHVFYECSNEKLTHEDIHWEFDCSCNRHNFKDRNLVF